MQQTSFGKQVKESQSEVIRKKSTVLIEEDNVPFFITDK